MKHYSSRTIALLKFLITRDGEATAWELERFSAKAGAKSCSVIRDLEKRGILELVDYGQYRITKAGRDVVKDFEGIWEAALKGELSSFDNVIAEPLPVFVGVGRGNALEVAV